MSDDTVEKWRNNADNERLRAEAAEARCAVMREALEEIARQRNHAVDHWLAFSALDAASQDKRAKALLNVVEAAKRLMIIMRRSVNVGPYTNDPSKEAKVFRNLNEAIAAWEAKP